MIGLLIRARPLLAVSFVVAAGAFCLGCGAASTAKPSSKAVSVEAHSIEALRKKDEAELYGPRELKARERADREAAAHAGEDEAHVRQQQAEEEQRQEGQEEAAKRAVEARRENEPDSHHYPASVRAAFVHECDRTSGHERSACECAIKRIEAKVPLGRFRQNSREVSEGKPLSFIYGYEIGYCATISATTG